MRAHTDGQLRPLATSIYYLLTCDASQGVFHMNKSAVRGPCRRARPVLTRAPQTMHVHHQGRAEYTLIHPTHPPRIEVVVRARPPHPGSSR